MYYRTIQTRGCIYIDFNILYLRCCDPCEITSQQFSTYVLYVRVRERVPCTKPPPSRPSSPSIYFSFSLLFSFSVYSDHSPLRSLYRYINPTPPPPFFRYFLFLSFSCPSEWSLRECVSPCLSLELFAHHAG